MTEHINYAEMVNSSMRNMIREVLRIAEKGALPGEHHFYITFITGAEGVCISNKLKARFPDEMTIVMQYEYENVVVTDTSFSLDLKFGGQIEGLVIPFAAIIAFADPSSKFALHFEAFDGRDTMDEALLAEESVVDLLKSENAKDEEKPTPGEVISLDQYRK